MKSKAYAVVCVAVVALTILPWCVSSTSPGCPKDMIWDGTKCRYPMSYENINRIKCKEGEHDDIIITYILQASRVTVKVLDQRTSSTSTFVEMEIPKDSLTSTMPYLTNDNAYGKLYQDVLNTTQFMDDWVEMSSRGDSASGPFANPMEAAANQCYKEYQTEVKDYIEAPPNAMIRFQNDAGRALLVDIFNVESRGASYLLTGRVAPPSSTLDVPEGQCHSKQDLDSPHYHHVSTCSDIVLEYNIEEASQEINGYGMTAFVKAYGGKGGIYVGSGGNGEDALR